MKNIKIKIEETTSNCIKVLQEIYIFLSKRQPKNLLRLLSNSSEFTSKIYSNGMKKTQCKICKL